MRFIFIIILHFLTGAIYAQPVADFTSDLNTACTPKVVKFTDLSSGTPTSWLWDFGNTNTSTIQNPAVIYTNPGAYTVTLIVSNVSGSDTIVKPYFIKAYAPPISGFYSDDTIVCAGSPVNFQDASVPQSSSVKEWFWDFGDGNNSTQSNPVHIYIAGGQYMVFLYITDANGCQSFKYRDNYVKVSDPKAEFEIQPSGCSLPISVNFENNSIGNSLSYFWDFNDGGTSGLSNPTHLFNNDGNLQMSLQVTDMYGCTDSITKEITIEHPGIDFSYSVSCSRDSSKITVICTDNSAMEPVSWNWDFGDGATDTVQDPTHVYNIYQEYSIQLIAAFENGCIDTVEKIYKPVLASFLADSFFCEAPVQVDFHNNSTGTGLLDYRWDFDDETIDSIINPFHFFNIESEVVFDTFFVSLAVADAFGCRDTIADTISFVRPYTKFDASATEGCIPLEVQFNDTSISPDLIISWSWDLGNGVTSTINDPATTYQDTGEYTVSLKIITEKGCRDSITMVDYIKSGLKPDYMDFIIEPYETGCFETIFDPDSLCFHHLYRWSNRSGFNDTTIKTNYWKWEFIYHPYYDSFWPDSSFEENPVFETGHAPPGIWDTVLLVTGFNGCNDSIYKAFHNSFPLSCIWHVRADGFPALRSDMAACSPPVTLGFYQCCIGYDSIIAFYATNQQTGAVTPLDPSDTTFLTFNYSGRYQFTIVSKNDTTKLGGCGDCNSHFMLVIDSVVNGFSATRDTSCEGWNQFAFSDTSQSFYGEIINVQWNFGDSDSLINDSVYYRCYYDTLKQYMFIDDTVFPAQIMGSDTVMSPVRNIDGNHEGRTKGTYRNPIHTYRDTGTYIIKCTETVQILYWCCGSAIYDTMLCYYTTFDTLRIDYPVYANFVTDTIGCSGSPVYFTDISTSISEVSSWKWSFGDNSPDDTIKNPVHIYGSKGKYQITLIAGNVNGCVDTLIREGYIYSPVADFELNESKMCCFGDSISITNKSLGDSIRCNWNFGDSHSDTLFATGHIYGTTGSYIISLSVLDMFGCADTTRDTILVVGRPAASFYADTIMLVCPPVPVMFRDSSSAGVDHWLWNFGDGQTSTEKNPSHLYYSQGDYSVTLAISDTNNCTDTLILNNYVSITGPIGDFDIVPDLGCLPHFVNFIANIRYTDYYYWDFGDGVIQFYSYATKGDSATHTYSSAGEYNVSLVLENINGCFYIVPETKTVNTLDFPLAAFSYDPAIHEKTVKFFDKSVDATKWWWNFGNGDTSVLKNPVYTYPERGEYLVMLIIFNKADCPDTATKTIYVPSDEFVKIPLAFSPNGDGLNDILYPFYFGIVEELEFKIFNRWGELVFETNDITAGWDGSYKGMQQDEGVFSYYIVAKMVNREEKIFQKGTITLLK